jgi:hypothetical protein
MSARAAVLVNVIRTLVEQHDYRCVQMYEQPSPRFQKHTTFHLLSTSSLTVNLSNGFSRALKQTL